MTPGDVHCLHAELSQSIEPQRLLVDHVVLPLEPLHAGIVRVELELDERLANLLAGARPFEKLFSDLQAPGRSRPGPSVTINRW